MSLTPDSWHKVAAGDMCGHMEIGRGAEKAQGPGREVIGSNADLRTHEAWVA